jgi:hypothetical protein
MERNELFEITIGSYEDYLESKRKFNKLLGKEPETNKKSKYNYLVDDKMRELCKLSR